MLLQQAFSKNTNRNPVIQFNENKGEKKNFNIYFVTKSIKNYYKKLNYIKNMIK